MRLNTGIRLPDGRVGTICYNGLDGVGGVFGTNIFTMPANGFGDELPPPEFMLAITISGKYEVAKGLYAEAVGTDYEIVKEVKK